MKVVTSIGRRRGKSDRSNALVQRVPFLLERCTGRDVLHLGCTNWPYTAASDANGLLLHRHLHDVSRVCTGFDSDSQGLNALRELGFDDAVLGDVERMESASLGSYDVVVAGEIIEHLSCPGMFLDSVRDQLRPDGELIVTTINAYCAFRFIAFALRGALGRREPVHPDHVSYYSRSTLSLLLRRHGWEVIGFHFYDIGVEHRPHLAIWQRAINDVFVRFAPHLADGVIAVCRPVASVATQPTVDGTA